MKLDINADSIDIIGAISCDNSKYLVSNAYKPRLITTPDSPTKEYLIKDGISILLLL